MFKEKYKTQKLGSYLGIFRIRSRHFKIRFFSQQLYTGAKLDFKRNDDARSSSKNYRDAQDDFASVSSA